MSASVWRWLAALLIVANLVLLVLHLRGGTANDEPRPTVPPLDPALPRLQLVQDLPKGQDLRADQCFSIGPLNSSLAQQRAEDRLRATALQLRSRQSLSDRDRGWWVFLPAGSRTEAIALTQQLAEDKLDDFFVVTRGEMENVVSVGLFENIDNARARQRQMMARGFQAELEIRRESAPQFWVDYQADAQLESAWRFILEASPGAQRRAIPCWDD